MSQYRNGIINSTTALISSGVNIALGFVPDKFQIYNYTKWTAASGVNYSLWINNVVPTAYAMIETVGIPSTITSAGITPVSLGGDWQNTTYVINTITNANPGVVTVASIAPTNSMTLVNGMTVTISGVNGMSGLNTNRFVVTQLTIVGGGPTYTFKLYDTFGNPVDTTALGTFATSPNAQIDVISYPATAPVLDAVTGQVIIPGQPVGNQYDIGYQGVNLASGVLGSNGDVLFWEAFLSTPTGW